MRSGAPTGDATAARALVGLVILGGNVTALAVARDAARLGLRVLAYTERDDIVARSRHVEARAVDGAPPAAVLERLAADADRSGPLALVACSDRWIHFIAAHRAELERRFALILHPSNDVLSICLSKRCFEEWMRAAGLPTPRSIAAEDARRMSHERALPFPMLLRPEFSLRPDAPPPPAKAAEARSPAELGEWLRAFDAAGCPLLVTESLLGSPLRQLSVAVAARGGDTLSFVAEKLRPRAAERAVGTYVRMQPHPRAEALALEVIAKLGFTGLAEVEILERVATGELYVIEVNARPWSQFALARRSGRDFLAFLTGLKSAANAAPLEEGLAWIDLSGDLYMCLSRSIGLVRHGHIGWGEYLTSLARANVHARFSLSDPAPWLYEWSTFLRRMLWRDAADGHAVAVAAREREG